MNSTIQFGFWNYVESGVMGKEAVRDWADLYCTLPMSFVFDPKIHKKSDMLEILDECEKCGMKLIICDKRTHFRTLNEVGEAAFTAGVKAAYDDFGRHPAAFGFFVGDEPSFEEKDLFIRAFQIVGQNTPNRDNFGNLLPYWGGGSDYDMLVGAAESVHTEAVEEIIQKGGATLIGYDQYSQCLNEAHNRECGINSYFYVLDQYRKNTEKYGIPFYTSLLACGHWGYRTPTEDDIRWQIYTALAHGARGIIWFHLYQYEVGGSYVDLPLIGKDRLRTPTFEAIRRQQYIFNEFYREKLDPLRVTDVYHVGHLYDPNHRFCADDILQDVNGKFSYPTILTYYKHTETGEKWLSVVNAHQRLSNRITLKCQNGNEHTFWLACGEMKLINVNNL